MNKKVQKSLDDLLETIFNSTEYREYKKAEDLWKKDKDSQKLLDEYFNARNTLQILEQGNFEGKEEQEKEVKKLEKKVNENKNIAKWFASQRKFQEFIWKQADYLTKNLKFPFSPTPRSRCGKGCC